MHPSGLPNAHEGAFHAPPERGTPVCDCSHNKEISLTAKLRVNYLRREDRPPTRKRAASGRVFRDSGDGLSESGRRDDTSGARLLQAHGAAVRVDEHALVAFVLPEGSQPPEFDVGCDVCATGNAGIRRRYGCRPSAVCCRRNRIFFVRVTSAA